MTKPVKFPSTAFVLSGNWEKEPLSNNQYRLKIESRIRVLAAGFLATNGILNRVIFSGGVAPEQGLPNEAEGMDDYFWRHVPKDELAGVQTLLDPDNHDTISQADSAHHTAWALGLQPPFTLITSAYHLPRASRIFEQRGVPIVPQAAEPVVASLSDHHKRFINRYQRSALYRRHTLREAIINSLHRYDEQDRTVNFLARLIRKTS
jgi:uncharacterized SAM-binding protein YcdF (DUF218 family)